MKKIIASFLTIASLGLISCGGDDDSSGSSITGSCTFTSTQCVNYSGTSADAASASLQSACEGVAGTWSTSSCSTSNYCGICTTEVSGITSEFYYYDGAGAESSLQSACELTGTWADNSSVTCT